MICTSGTSKVHAPLLLAFHCLRRAFHVKDCVFCWLYNARGMFSER